MPCKITLLAALVVTILFLGGPASAGDDSSRQAEMQTIADALSLSNPRQPQSLISLWLPNHGNPNGDSSDLLRRVRGAQCPGASDPPTYCEDAYSVCCYCAATKEYFCAKDLQGCQRDGC